MESLQAGKKRKIIFLIFIIFFVLLQSYPVFWVLIASLKTPEEIAGSAPYALPGSFYLGNYIKAFTQSSLVRYFLNSVVVAICTLFGIVVLSAPAAYAISKIRFKQSEKVLTFFLLGMMIPTFSCLIPMFQTYNTLGLRNTYAAVILPQIGFSLPMCIFLYVGFMKYIPNELLEAGMVDGVGPVRGFVHVILPVCKPILGAAAALSFADCWNMVEQPLIYLANHTNLQPLSVMFNQISTDRADVAFAGSALYILPTLLIYLYFQEDIVAGIQLSELK